ncbi:hypothetical protein MHAS44199_09135 [Mycolicibacterium hassiacum DSM 44199]|nr:hypothetical protein [Mycolicibacterium hassiacum DSM 44199]
MGFETEPLRLERDRAAAGEGIQDGRGIAVGRLEDLGSGFGQERFVVGVLPHDESLDELMEAFPLLALEFFGGELLRAGRRIVNELCEQHRTGSGERTARPPQMKCRRVPMPDGLLPR